MSDRLIQSTPEFWSDFDGTAVKVVPKYDPRNWTKYPLPKLPGYEQFLAGVRRGAVEVGGVVSRRPNIGVRRLVTARSIAVHGLYDYFPSRNQVRLTGSEAAKAAYVAALARQRVIGLAEDKPHKVGPLILSELVKALEFEEPSQFNPRVAIGVVNHPRSGEYIDRTMDAVGDNAQEAGLHVFQRSGDGAVSVIGPDDRFRLDVVQLAPYSEATGRNFASYLYDSQTQIKP